LGSFAYLDVAGCRVTAGAPRAEADKLATLLAEFAVDCKARGLRRVHFGMPGSVLEFLEGPVTRVHVGDLPVFNLDRWRSEKTLSRNIRAQVHRARNHGVTVRFLAGPPADTTPLRECLHLWLRAKSLPPMSFVTTPFVFDPWPGEGILVAEREGRAVGFLASSRVFFGDMSRVDVICRAPGAPNGTAELLVAESFRRAAEHGLARATLGLAPLARRSGTRDSGASLGTLSAIGKRLTSPLYSFKGLETFKAKFGPDEWVPLYCVAPGTFFGPRDILAVARAFSGGSFARYILRAVAWKAGARRLSR
jgi:phosphatidylglycerol lysyltransferase